MAQGIRHAPEPRCRAGFRCPRGCWRRTCAADLRLPKAIHRRSPRNDCDGYRHVYRKRKTRVQQTAGHCADGMTAADGPPLAVGYVADANVVPALSPEPLHERNAMYVRRVRPGTEPGATEAVHHTDQRVGDTGTATPYTRCRRGIPGHPHQAPSPSSRCHCCPSSLVCKPDNGPFYIGRPR